MPETRVQPCDDDTHEGEPADDGTYPDGGEVSDG